MTIERGMQGDEELRQLAAELPWDRPDESRREAMRGALLAAVRTEPPRGASIVSIFSRRSVVAGSVLLAAAAAAAVIVMTRGGAGGAHGGHGGEVRALAAIEAGSGASYDRHVAQTDTGSDEVVRLRAGALHVTAGALAPGDHLRVASGDAEVDAQGDVDVAVVGDAMDHVTVRSGSARVTLGGQRPVFLASGQTWHAATITATVELPPAAPVAPVVAPVVAPGVAAAPVPAIAEAVVAGPAARPAVAVPAALPVVAGSGPRVTAAREPAPRTETREVAPRPVAHVEAAAVPDAAPAIAPTPAPVLSSPPSSDTAAGSDAERRRGSTEQHFQRGTQLLRDRHAAEAAAELGLAADGATDGLAVDARYYQAVALVKANRPADAEHALVAFLDHASTSSRRGRASVMLGRLLATHDQGSARAWFQAALADPDASVATAARAGLESLR